MTTQTIPPEAISVSDWQQLFTHEVDAGDVAWRFHLPEPTVTVHPSTPETPPEPEQSHDHPDSREISKTVGRIAMSVLMTDSDERLDYLQTLNPNLTEDHLDQIALTTDRWLDHPARDRMRAIVRRCHDSQSYPKNMLIEWTTPEEVQRLVDLLLETSIPDPTLAMCYAMCAAHDTAYAAFRIHENRAHRQADFSNIEQTPEEIAGDLRFVNAE